MNIVGLYDGTNEPRQSGGDQPAANVCKWAFAGHPTDPRPNVRDWWFAACPLPGRTMANLTARSVLLLNPEYEGVVAVKANQSAVEGRGGERVPSERITVFPVPVA